MRIDFRTTIILSAIALLSLSLNTYGEPRFAAKVEQKCNLCHVSPTGGGMRIAFGSQYFAQTELAVHKTPFEEITKFQPSLSQNISIGMDARSLMIYDKEVKQSTFFQMEGNFYLDVQFDKNFSAALKKDLYNNSFEVYGMGYILPWQGYVRVGKFQPSYGWRFADHTSFVREKMLWPPTSMDTGLEFGLYPFGISANVGVFNGTTGMLDDNQGKAVSARLEFRKHINKFGLGAGASFWRNDTPAGAISMYGPFFYFNGLGAKLIYTGEIDWLDNKQIHKKSLASTHNFNYMITQGIWATFAYDFYDSDTELKNGVINRYGFGIDYFPIGFVEIQPMIKYYDDHGTKHTQFVGDFHFFF